jgi:hypothetical protein
MLDQRLAWLAARPDLHVIGLRVDVCGDCDAVPSVGVVGIVDVAAVKLAVSNIDQAVVGEPNRDRRLIEVVDALRTQRDEPVEIRGRGASLHLEAEGSRCGQHRVAAPPAVLRAHVGACPRALLNLGGRRRFSPRVAKSCTPCAFPDLAHGTGADEDEKAEDDPQRTEETMFNHNATP